MSDADRNGMRIGFSCRPNFVCVKCFCLFRVEILGFMHSFCLHVQHAVRYSSKGKQATDTWWVLYKEAICTVTVSFIQL